MTADASRESREPQAPQILAAGLRCVGCDYELTGLAASSNARCPECGVSLEGFTSGSKLARSNPVAVARYADALALFAIGTAADAVAYLGVFLPAAEFTPAYYLVDGCSLTAWLLGSWRLAASLHEREAERFGVHTVLRVISVAVGVLTVAMHLGRAPWFSRTPLLYAAANAAWTWLVFERIRTLGTWASDVRMVKFARPLAVLSALVGLSPGVIELLAGSVWADPNGNLTRWSRAYYAAAIGAAAATIAYLIQGRGVVQRAIRIPPATPPAP